MMFLLLLLIIISPKKNGWRRKGTEKNNDKDKNLITEKEKKKFYNFSFLALFSYTFSLFPSLSLSLSWILQRECCAFFGQGRKVTKLLKYCLWDKKVSTTGEKSYPLKMFPFKPTSSYFKRAWDIVMGIPPVFIKPRTRMGGR